MGGGEAGKRVKKGPPQWAEKLTGDSWNGYDEDAHFFPAHDSPEISSQPLAARHAATGSAAPLLIPQAFMISAQFASGPAARWECHGTCLRPVEIRSHLFAQCHGHMQHWHGPLRRAAVWHRSLAPIVVA